MARLARLAVAGVPHHVLLIGHNGNGVFVDAEDRRAFVELMREALLSNRASLHGYVLLDSEVHLLLTPDSVEALSRSVQALCRRYGARFNRRHERSGTLWDGRFRAAPLEPEPWLLTSLAVIETLPARLGLVGRDAEFRWSSAAHHLGLRRDPAIVEHERFWALGNTPFDREAAWRALLEQAPSEAQASILLASVRKGWAVGSAAFLARIGEQTNRPLRPRPRGRPPAS